ncbi:MAG TPA: carboxypeptidase regulatory-like domain-containing protein [Blastocatellia bacterium]|nr:carboxypeptidase regulatory-like domain-containing protein [Blastocatellia bacterium]
MLAKTRNVIRMMLLLGLACGAIPAAAQDITGSIVGIVKDANGAVVAGATVTIRNTDKNVVARTMNTNEEGSYSAPFLLAGHYSVTIEATGFKKFVKTEIELNVNDRIAVDATLEAGAVNEEIVVTAGGVQIETQTATAAGLVSNTEVRELPLNNRNFVQLVTLLPGVSSTMTDQAYIGTTNPFGQVNTVSISINGGRIGQNSWTIDGADNVDRGSNITLLNYPSVDAIAEFKVLRNHYSAEYGRNASGHVNVITKSGGREFHGNVYEFFRNDKLNANPFFNNLTGRFTTDPTAKSPDLIVPAGDPRAGKERVPRPQLRYNNFGYTIGGPVFIPDHYNKEREKTFFFFSQEFRRVITYSSFNATVPSAAERQGIFSAPICIATNAAGTACTQSATQISNFNPAAAAYLKDIYSNIELPNSGTNTLISNARNVFNHRQELIRVDHNFSPRVTLAVRYLHDTIPTEEPGGLFTGLLVPGVATTKTDSPGYSWVARSVQTINPTMINEAGYAFSYGAIISRPIGLALSENSPNVAAAIKLPFAVTLDRIPNISPGFSGVQGFGPYDDFNRNHNFYDNLTWIRGVHALKFGTSINFYQKTENAAKNNVGTFSFATAPRPAGSAATTTMQQWANFLLGNVSTFTQADQDLTPDLRSRQYEFYAQDDFRWMPNLTVNFGVRYSRFRQPFDKNGQLTNFDPRSYDPAKAVQIDPATGNVVPNTGDRLNGIIIAGQNSPFGDKVAPESNNDFAPVFGFAWDPFKTGKTAIRGGYGISYDVTLVGVLELNIFGNPPFVNNVSISNTVLNNPASVLPTLSAAPFGTIRGTQFESDIPYVQQWSLDVQREVSKDFLIAVGYYGSKGTHLPGIVDFNEVAPGAAVAAGLQTPGVPIVAGLPTNKLNAIRPFKGFVAVNSVQNWFNSNYNSLQISADKRFVGGSLVRVSYTLSHALTDNQSDNGTAPQSFYDRGADYGPSQLDRRQILSINYVYEIPFFSKQHGFLGNALGGWQLSGITSFAGGTPFTVTTSGTDPGGLGLLGPSASSGRPDVIRNPNLTPAERTRLRWFDTQAFTLVPAGLTRPGNSPRGVIIGPGYQKWDVTLAKRFKVTESLNIQFRAEAYNILNHANFLGLNTSFGATAFGQTTGTRDPRLIQFALKLTY